MFVDVMGKTKLKIGVVLLPNLDKSVYKEENIKEKLSEIAAEYAKAGYDAISVGMPYDYINETEIEGIKIFTSCLYTFGDTLDDDKKFAVLGFGMDMQPDAQSDWRNLQRTAHLKAAEVIGLPPEDCIVFEDARAGILSANNANIGSVWAVIPQAYLSPLSDETKVDGSIADFTGYMEIIKKYL